MAYKLEHHFFFNITNYNRLYGLRRFINYSLKLVSCAIFNHIKIRVNFIGGGLVRELDDQAENQVFRECVNFIILVQSEIKMKKRTYKKINTEITRLICKIEK